MDFAKNVLDEVIALCPSPYIHVGADEVPAAPWRNCATCKAAMEELGKTPLPVDVKVFRVHVAGGAGVPFQEDIGRLQGGFIRKIDRHIAARGRQMVGWDEILDGGLRTGSSAVAMA
jgi:hexosaminidase